ncbi:class I SAM-dependent methyltransferase [Zobellella denitrificans]
MNLLLPVDSRIRNTQGFILLNIESGTTASYPTDEKFSFNRKGFRGGCLVGDVLYVCNSFSVKAYKLEGKQSTDFSYTLQWQLQLPEWLIGKAANADLHTLYFDSTRQILLLANSFMDSIDLISMDGQFLGREFLWEISDSVRSLVQKRDPAAPDLCHLNHISTAFGHTFLTLGNLNISGKGAILHRESGNFVIKDLERPHDGVFWEDEFWITETSAYRLRVYSDIRSVDDFKDANYRIIDLSHHTKDGNKFWYRGLYITKNRVFLGCSQFQDRNKDLPDMPPSHILEIDKKSGEVLNKFHIPGDGNLPRPVIFSLLPWPATAHGVAQPSLCKTLQKPGTTSENNKEQSIAMSNTLNDNRLSELEKRLLQAGKANSNKFTRDLIIVQNRLYAQLESLSWLQRRLAINGQLPPLRGWATSPDVLLHLHTHIMATRPKVVIEFGSGASTLVIADALCQNGSGRLVSIEHSDFYGAQTLTTLHAEKLHPWVDLRIGDLEDWDGEHLNPEGAEKPSRWYPQSLLQGVDNIDLLWVDGPPGATCLFSRYPALPALFERLTPQAQIWMDDTIRQEEVDICSHWAEKYNFDIKYLPLEKGLGILTRKGIHPPSPVVIHHDSSHITFKNNNTFDFGDNNKQLG